MDNYFHTCSFVLFWPFPHADSNRPVHSCNGQEAAGQPCQTSASQPASEEYPHDFPRSLVKAAAATASYSRSMVWSILLRLETRPPPTIAHAPCLGRNAGGQEGVSGNGAGWHHQLHFGGFGFWGILDILISSGTKEEHSNHLPKVFNRLHKASLAIY